MRLRRAFFILSALCAALTISFYFAQPPPPKLPGLTPLDDLDTGHQFGPAVADSNSGQYPLKRRFISRNTAKGVQRLRSLQDKIGDDPSQAPGQLRAVLGAFDETMRGLEGDLAKFQESITAQRDDLNRSIKSASESIARYNGQVVALNTQIPTMQLLTLLFGALTCFFIGANACLAYLNRRDQRRKEAAETLVPPTVVPEKTKQ